MQPVSVCGGDIPDTANMADKPRSLVSSTVPVWNVLPSLAVVDEKAAHVPAATSEITRPSSAPDRNNRLARPAVERRRPGAGALAPGAGRAGVVVGMLHSVVGEERLP